MNEDAARAITRHLQDLRLANAANTQLLLLVFRQLPALRAELPALIQQVEVNALYSPVIDDQDRAEIVRRLQLFATLAAP